MSDRAHFRRLEALFERAIALPADERERFVDDQCADDADLAAKLRRMLAQDNDADPIGALLSPLSGDAGLAGGERIGQYETVRELGRGGMGAVYLAVRADDAFRKEVAIKLVGDTLARPDLLERFYNEREILARLEHPNVARVLDGGTTESGQPYVVMEYVDGKPIDRWCDAQRLPLRARLELFRQVCSAVHYAHTNLIVHRDIKPANVLVTTDGTPKLLDFGIAKLLPGDAAPVDATRTQLRALTPDYASPEQVRGEPVTTATDVYSLGVLLHRLLVGTTPFDFATSTAAEIERTLLTAPVRPPSHFAASANGSAGSDGIDPAAIAAARDASPDRLRRRLSGDLDNIVLTALRKEPARRYSSVEQFSNDVDRHLRGLPVSARPDTWRYRASKFIGRHRVAVAAAAVVAALVVGFAATTALQAQRIAAERDRANREAQAAERVTEFLTGLFEVSNPGESRGNSITAREVLDRGAGRIEDELAGQPRVQARLRGTIGEIYRSLGLYAQAQPLLEATVAQRRELLGEEHADTLTAMDRLALLHWYAGRYDEAEALYLPVLAGRRAQLGNDDPATVATMKDLADTYWGQGRLADAEPLQREALAVRLDRFGAVHEATVDSYMGLGVLLAVQERYEEAEPLFTDALEANRSLHGEDHPTTLNSMVNLANLYRFQGRSQESLDLNRHALELGERVRGAEHPESLIGRENLADFYQSLERYDEAEPLARQVLEVRLRVLGESHPDTLRSMEDVGALEIATDRGDAGLQRLARAEALSREHLEQSHPLALSLALTLGESLAKAGRPRDALPHFETATRTALKALGPLHSTTLRGLTGALRGFHELERADDADALGKVWLTAAEQAGATPTPDVLRLHARSAALRKDWDATVERYERAVVASDNGDDRTSLLREYAAALRDAGRYEAAAAVAARTN